MITSDSNNEMRQIEKGRRALDPRWAWTPSRVPTLDSSQALSNRTRRPVAFSRSVKKGRRPTKYGRWLPWLLACYWLSLPQWARGVSRPGASECTTKLINGQKQTKCNHLSLSVIPTVDTETIILYMNHNQLAKLADGAFAGLPELQKLYLSNNAITTIEPGAFRGLVNLAELDLSSNRIVRISKEVFTDTKYLQRLKLSHNSKLEVIQNDSFIHLPSLEKLELNGCGLRELQPTAFRGLYSLRFLHLAHNSLRTMRYSVLDDARSHLNVLYLYNNKWHCTCDLRWLRVLVGTPNVTYDLVSKFTKCASPDTVQDRNWRSLDPVSFACAPELLVPDIATKTFEENSGATNLTCRVYSDPPTKPRWFHDGREIPWGDKEFVITTKASGHRTKVSTLRIPYMTNATSGEFKCLASNSAGQVQMVTHIAVVPRPPLVAPSTVGTVSGYEGDADDAFRPRGSTLLIKLIMGVIALLLFIVVFAVGTVVFRWQKKLRDDKLRSKTCLAGFDNVPFSKVPAQEPTSTVTTMASPSTTNESDAKDAKPDEDKRGGSGGSGGGGGSVVGQPHSVEEPSRRDSVNESVPKTPLQDDLPPIEPSAPPAPVPPPPHPPHHPPPPMVPVPDEEKLQNFLKEQEAKGAFPGLGLRFPMGLSHAEDEVPIEGLLGGIYREDPRSLTGEDRLAALTGNLFAPIVEEPGVEMMVDSERRQLTSAMELDGPDGEDEDRDHLDSSDPATLSSPRLVGPASVLETPIFPSGKLPSHALSPNSILPPSHLGDMPGLLPASSQSLPANHPALLGLSPLECLALSQRIAAGGRPPDLDELLSSVVEGGGDDVGGVYNVADETPFWVADPLSQNYYQQLSRNLSPEEAAHRVALGLTPPPPELLDFSEMASPHRGLSEEGEAERTDPRFAASPSSSPTSGSVVSTATPVNLPPADFNPQHHLLQQQQQQRNLLPQTPSHHLFPQRSFVSENSAASPTPASGAGFSAPAVVVVASDARSTPAPAPPRLSNPLQPPRQRQQLQQLQPGMRPPFSSNTLPHPHNMKVRFTPELEGKGTDV